MPPINEEFTLMAELDLMRLRAAVDGAVAIRRVIDLAPAGGDGDKVFPPTYKDGEYAFEERRIEGVTQPCVLLDSVQSQANRIESELLRAWDAGRIPLPVVAVDFQDTGLAGVKRVTSLDAPHRLSDAILRDSQTDGRSFPEFLEQRGFGSCGPANATLLYELCPTALLFGMWDSTGRRGGAGVKFQRALVAEIVGVDAIVGKRVSSRIDPLKIQKDAALLYEAKSGDWTLDEKEAKKDKSKPRKFGKEGKPSEANHGNVTPTIATGGVTMRTARLTTVISLPALRRLSFPAPDGTSSVDRDRAGHVALLALALAGAALTTEAGYDLRSRCLLVPRAATTWTLLTNDGPQDVSVDAAAALDLVERAAKAAEKAGLPAWKRRKDGELGTLVLEPQAKLVELVKRSQALEVTTAGEE